MPQMDSKPSPSSSVVKMEDMPLSSTFQGHLPRLNLIQVTPPRSEQVELGSLEMEEDVPSDPVDLDTSSLPSSPLALSAFSSPAASRKRMGRSRHPTRILEADSDARMRHLEHSRRRQQSQFKWMEWKTKMPMYNAEDGSLNIPFRDNFFALCGLGKETRHQVAMIREVLESQAERWEKEVNLAVRESEKSKAIKAVTLTLVADDFGRTALHFAAVSGRDDVCECLCQYGAIVDARDNRGNTPIDLAATSAHLETVIVLQNNGASLTPSGDDEGGPRKPKALLLAEMRLNMLLANIRESRARLVRDAAERRYDGNISSPPSDRLESPVMSSLALSTTRSTADTLNDAQAIVAFLRQFCSGVDSQGDRLHPPTQLFMGPFEGMGRRRRTNSIQSVRLEPILEEATQLSTENRSLPISSISSASSSQDTATLSDSGAKSGTVILDLVNLDLLSARLAKIGLDCELSRDQDNVRQAQAAEALEETLGNLSTLLTPLKSVWS